ncbi:DMT family transporter [soil metagenome]
MERSTSSPGTLTLAAFAVAVLLGGANFLAVRFSNQELPPFWGAGLRFTVAGVLFVFITSTLRLKWPRGRELALTGAYGIFTFTLSYALMYWALLQISAGMAAVVLAIVPLTTPLLASVQRLERLNRRALTGALIALAGIVWMTVEPEGADLPLSGLVAILVAAFTIGQSVILGKRVSQNHPAVTNAVGMAVGAPLLLALSAIAGESWSLPTQPEVVWSVLYLVTFGSVGLFVAMLLVIRRWTASASSYAFVLFPVVTMLLEAWLADEPLTIRGLVGVAIVMAGVWVGALAPKRIRLAIETSG